MNIAVVGTGYVGLVTGVALSDIGHNVTCIDIDIEKVKKMKRGESPIYEPGLEDIMKKNIEKGRLDFTKCYEDGLKNAQVAYIAVGTPEKEDGTADLRFIEAVAESIGQHAEHDIVVVTKSTVPVGTNDYIREIIQQNLFENMKVDVVSNPEFLREGSAVHDAFHGDRIVIGADTQSAADTIEQVNLPFGIPIYKTDIRSAEMIKYASNAFLATKISFVNEISNLCDALGANIEDVTAGMGMDARIGNKFLNAGIGYGGSCFPKDTSALVQLADQAGEPFELLRSVIKTNDKQKRLLVEKAKERFGSLQGKTVALLGLAFKPNTDDMREAPSITIAQELVLAGANVVGYDPIATENAKNVLPGAVTYATTAKEACQNADFAMILTEWDEIQAIQLDEYKSWLNEPILFDGRNCHNPTKAKQNGIEYHSIGRPTTQQQKQPATSPN
ncbi:UDP-glucose dehydrogenase family protein [Texcoconibacillus texcoconensis]|uniref:UDP-glucose 6-dehydrogenase n=1 Tax=Texcoconibacillus texcoconensis TaxID=1095777 RepID=A0A840QTC5_9BACI|nr:UDP-glucose/GDP-mannose dehydrogenase family protein [Texcoconibacillus texcoconensis]MBB5174541.1 UDPglucose 6-dehydrogenase [Texcoconibacillus texcoconensis]